MTTRGNKIVKLLLCGLAVVISAFAGAGETAHRGQDLPQRVARLEEGFHAALRQGDTDRATQLLPQAERLESQLIEILENPQSNRRAREELGPLLEII